METGTIECYKIELIFKHIHGITTSSALGLIYQLPHRICMAMF